MKPHGVKDVGSAKGQVRVMVLSESKRDFMDCLFNQTMLHRLLTTKTDNFGFLAGPWGSGSGLMGMGLFS